MKKVFSHIVVYPLLVIVMTVNMSANAYAVPVSSYAQFADNLNSGRFVLDKEEYMITGESGSPIAPVVAFIGGIIVGATISHYWDKALDRFDEWVLRQFDPQDAFLFTTFEINQVSIFDGLVYEATLPENVVFEQYLPNFLGGATFTATKSFSGNFFNEEGNLIPNIELGYGVFTTDNSVRYFAPITFVETLSDLNLIKSMEWDLSPVEQGMSGSFRATGLHLQASEAPVPVPEPSTLLLLGSGLVGIIGFGRKRLFKKA